MNILYIFHSKYAKYSHFNSSLLKKLLERQNDVDEPATNSPNRTKIRLKIAQKLYDQKQRFETISAERPLEPAEKEAIFKYPEDLIPSLFLKIEEKWQPKKFRKSDDNPLGFEIQIQNEAEFNCLEGYDFQYKDGFGNNETKVSSFIN